MVSPGGCSDDREPVPPLLYPRVFRLVVVKGGNGRPHRVAATPRQVVASDTVLRAHRDNLGGACVPVGGVRPVTDPQASGVPLVHQSHGGVQTGRTIKDDAGTRGVATCRGDGLHRPGPRP